MNQELGHQNLKPKKRQDRGKQSQNVESAIYVNYLNSKIRSERLYALRLKLTFSTQFLLMALLHSHE